ncbi:SOS response-associated peptidase [Proteobacteria bacterium 005FR1]|nr:SOS response-associated peptidase [Proteobacteria bacterium 005FR1]
MCGRYLLRNAPKEETHPLWSEFWRNISVFSPRFNICPSEESPVIRRVAGELVCEPLKWGFKPSWSKYHPVINARAENVFSSKMYRKSLLQRRCLVLADGFYEPKGPQGAKNRPWYLFEYEDGRSFCFAGLWINEGFTLITCEANSLIAAIHDRMPLIIDPRDQERWLAGDLDEHGIQELLMPRDYPGMISRPVSDYVKKPGNEGPQCIAAVGSA